MPNNSDDENTFLKKIFNWLKGNKWTIIGVSILFFFNYLIYEYVYFPTNPQGGLWNYIESDGFNVITVSLILPILLLIFGQIFKIKDKVTLQRQVNAYKRKDLEKKYQLITINETVEFWSDLISLSTQVRFFDSHHVKRIEDVRVKIDELIIREEYLANMWSFRFKELNEYNVNYKELLRTPIDVLIDSTYTVAKNIHDNSINSEENKNSEEIKMLQYQLGVIETNVKNMAYNKVISVLNNVMTYDFHKHDSSYEGNEYKKLVAKIQIEHDIQYLKDWTEKIHNYVNQNNEITYFMKYESSKRCLQCLCECFEEICRMKMKNFRNKKKFDENLEEKIELCLDLEEYKEKLIENLTKNQYLKNSFKIDDYTNVQSTKPCYSNEFMCILARELDFENLCAEIVERAYWEKTLN
jgi:hypothetical protein